MAAFQCAEWLCQGGTCNDALRVCEACPEGYTRDCSYFIQANCAMPEGAYQWAMIASLVCTAVSLCVLVPSAMKTKPRGAVRVIHVCAMGVVLGCCASTVAMYLSNGWLVASNVFNFVTAASLIVLLPVSARVVVLPLFASAPHLKRRTDRGIRSLFLVDLVVSFSLMVVMTASASFEQRDAYNAVALTLWTLLGATVLITNVSVRWASRRLVAILRSTAHGASSASSTVEALNSVNFYVTLTCAPVFCSCFAIVAIFCALGGALFFFALNVMHVC